MPADGRLHHCLREQPGLIAVMGWQAALHFGFHLGLTDWLELVADLPVSAQGYTRRLRHQRLGRPIRRWRAPASTPRDGFTNVPPPDAAPLDWRLGFKARLFRTGHVRPRRSPPS